MLSPKQKKIASKAGDPNKIDAKDFAVLKAEKAKGRGMGLEDEKLEPGKEYKMKAGGMTKGQKKIGKVMKEFKAGKLHSGKSKKIVKNPKQAIAIALSEAGKSKKVMKAETGDLVSSDKLTEIDVANAERIARSRPLPMLEEYKRKPITPKERRQRDIEFRSQKKMMGGGMIQEPMGYSHGGEVRGGRKEIKGLRPAKLF